MFAGSTVEPTLAARWGDIAVDSQGEHLETTLGRMAEELAPNALEGVPEGVVEIGEPIGSGGMGEVRRATQHRLRREVAVKRALRETVTSARGAMLR